MLCRYAHKKHPRCVGVDLEIAFMIDLANGQLDRYQLRERLGSGGMARVYKAWDTNLERLVAIKILHEHLADDPTFKERFEREAKFIASFNHPNIVQLYDFNVSQREGFPLYYMVMSYIPGQTLADHLDKLADKGERLPRERVLALVTNITEALSYAHARGMVHRDVKPGNILLNENGDAILTDFGIARMIQSNRLTQDGVSTGTPIYMSPEQANGKPGDTRTDLYSLGIIVFEMLTGQPPFVDDNSLSVMLKHLNAQPPYVSEFIGATRYDLFVRKALAKEPDDRYQNAEEFLRAFRATFSQPDHGRTTILPSQEAIPVIKMPTSAATSLFITISQTARKNPRTSAAIVTVVTLVVVLLIFLLLSQRSARFGAEPSATAEIDSANVPSMTDTNPYFTSSFAPDDMHNAYWSTDGTEFLTRSFTPDGQYQLQNTRISTAETSIAKTDTVYSSMAIGIVARLEPSSQPASGYGIVFRYHDEDNYNVFAVDGMGRYSIWVRSQAEWHELRRADENWTYDEAINPLGENNDLSVTIIGDFITGYVNNKRVTRVTDGTLDGGKIGLYFATDDGPATVTVDEYRVYASVPSMTGQ